MALANQLRGVRRVLNDTVAIDDIERSVGIRQGLAVGHPQFIRSEAVQGKVFLCQVNGGLGQVDARDVRAAGRETDQVGANTAAHFKEPLPFVGREVD